MVACRARLADPFWEATGEILPPAQLKPQTGRPPMLTAGGMQEVQCADRVFYLNQQQLEDVSRSPGSHRVQVRPGWAGSAGWLAVLCLLGSIF